MISYTQFNFKEVLIMKINGVNVELAINEADILDLLENYKLDLNLPITSENISRYVEEQRASLLERHQHLSKVVTNLYEVKLSELTQEQEKTQTQIASDALALEQLVQSANNRKEFCSEAKGALSTLKKIINKEIPFSTLETTKEELLAYFECQPTERVAELITALYDEEQAKNSLYGWIRSKFTSAPTEPTEEEVELIGLINAKLRQIEKELKLGALDKKIPKAPKDLADNNLYYLSKFHQNGKRHLKEKETFLAQQKEHFATIAEQQNVVLKELEARKSEQELQILLTGFGTRLEKLTMDCNELQEQLTTVDKVMNTVKSIHADLKTKKIDEILALISTNHSLFLSINGLVDLEHFSENSIHQINQDIHKLLIVIKEELAVLQNTAEGVNPMPEELAKRQQFLMSQLKELESKYSGLTITLHSSVESLSNYKKLIDPFIKLAQIKNQYTHFIEQITPGMNDQSRQELVSAIEIVRKEKVELLTLIHSEEYEGLLTLKQVKDSLQDQENILSDFLIAERLNQIKDDYLRVVEKSKLIPGTNPNEVIEWVHGIDELEKQTGFLERASLSKNPVIQQQIKTLEDLREELHASLYGQYEGTTRIVSEFYDAQLAEEKQQQTKNQEQISLTKMTLERLVAQVDERKVFLGKARDTLGELQKILVENKEHKVLQIPQEGLLAYFEEVPAGRVSILINALYESEQTKSSWYGFTRKNIWNRLTFAYNSEESTAAKKELGDLIEARLLQINNELEINDITESVERPSRPSNLAENNLYTLSASYRNSQKTLVDTQATLEQQIKNYEQISEQKDGTLDLLESIKTSHEQVLFIKEAQMLLNKTGLEQDKIGANNSLLQREVKDLEQTYHELSDMLATIETLPRSAITVLLENNYPLLKERIDHHQESLRKLTQDINESFKSHRLLFAGLEALFSQITKKPSPMTERKETLLEEFNELQTKKILLDESITRLIPQVLEAQTKMEEAGGFAPRLSEPKIEKQKNTASLNTPLHLLSNVYFGTETEQADAEFGIGGIFGAYLEERANTFWFKDFFSTIAAFALGCFGYKTEAQQRQEYLTNDLQPALTTYQNEPTMESHDDLIKVIKNGKFQFSPRTVHNEIDKSKSLFSKLSQLETEVVRINLNLNELEDSENHTYRNGMN